jgi:hypothetical protein
MRFKALLLLIILGVFLNVSFVQAQNKDALTLTITPPLVKLNMDPGGMISSSIKVVNNNNHPITVYTRVFDFKGTGGKIKPLSLPAQSLLQATSSPFLSQWITIEKGPIEIGPQQSRNISFMITAPKTAEPGGHYAAIAVGTQPEENIKGSGAVVTSMLTSLIFVTINGDYIERGRLLEFSTDKSLYQSPEVAFKFSFENTGTVHLLPQGEIKIYNMFGKEIGSIAVNQGSYFENVLPNDTREWKVKWKADKRLLDMGRARATIVLSYGTKAAQTVFRSLNFWIIDFKLIGLIFGSIFLFFLILFISIKIYVRRAVLRTQQNLGLVTPQTKPASPKATVMPAEDSQAETIDLRPTRPSADGIKPPKKITPKNK